MRVAFYNIFGEMKNAEQETLMRLKYVFEKQGHELLVIDRDGYVINQCREKGMHVEDARIDFLFTYNTTDFSQVVIPDAYSVFAHWSPIGFVANFQAILELKMLNSYDYFSCTYERDIFNRFAQIRCSAPAFFGSSVPADFAVSPERREKRKLFYVGVNFERALDKMRYGTLLSELDQTGDLEIYGPKKVYGRNNLWAGFDSYCGEIPFDGKSIIKKISQAGICLALNSPMHNDADAVSNRTYEAAAAGAVIISDENDFVRKYFGDSVFYLERGLSEEDTSERIKELLAWINNHPQEAYEMACQSQQAFLEHLTLDKMTTDFMEKTSEAIAQANDRMQQPDIIDIICFADTASDIRDICKQLRRQYYQNLHLVIVSKKEDICHMVDIPYPYDFVQSARENKGECFAKSIPLLRGNFFMFMDKESVMHMRHICKNHDVLCSRGELFSYSGCYLRKSSRVGEKYIVMNNKPILRNEFLLFSTASNENVDWHFRDAQTFYIETIFSRSAALFKKEILKYADTDELKIISDNVHMYLSCCSIIKANRLGRFTYALTTGYWGDSVAEAERRIFAYPRRHWYSNGRSAKTYIKEFNEVFFKYTFEADPKGILNRNFNGEITWYGEVQSTSPSESEHLDQNISWKRKLVRRIKKMIPRRVKDFVKKCIYA